MSIYAFYDEGYTTGVKVGRGKAATYISEAQSWSPRNVVCCGVWSVEGNETAVEKSLHARLSDAFGALRIPNESAPTNGKEWFDMPVAGAPEVIERALKTLPRAVRRENNPVPSTKKADPLASTPAYKGRLVLWMMQEKLTGSLKLYQCSEWKSPREKRRRYSRNGYRAHSAVTYLAKASLPNNHKLDAIRNDCIRHFGAAPGKDRFGWLAKNVQAEAVQRWLLDNHGEFLEPVGDITSNHGRPCGVRQTYNKMAENIPESELASCFAEIWW